MTQRQKTTKIPKFLRALYQMLETEDPSILSWTEDGSAFQIFNLDALEHKVLPKYFKHNKFTSFQRQLNNFHFRKWTKTRALVCTFSHDVLVRCDLSYLGNLVAKLQKSKTLCSTDALESSHKRARCEDSDSEPSAKHIKTDIGVGEPCAPVLARLDTIDIDDLDLALHVSDLWAVDGYPDDMFGTENDCFGKIDILSEVDEIEDTFGAADWSILADCLLDE